MPLPIIHSYAGYSIYKLSKTEQEKDSWKMASLYMILANVADFDVIPGLLMGSSGSFHRDEMHSLVVALGFALLVAGIGKLLKSKTSAFRLFWISLAAYFSHIFLDAFTGTVSFIYWPFQVKSTPVTFLSLYEHAQPMVAQCRSVNQFLSMLVCSTLTLRLACEALMVFSFHALISLFSRTRATKAGISESPVFVAGLTIFLFVVTALIVTGVAG